MADCNNCPYKDMSSMCDKCDAQYHCPSGTQFGGNKT